MLCPEVWNLSANQKKPSYFLANFNKNGKENINKLIDNQPFNDMVSVILPDCDTVPLAVEQSIKANDYYIIRNLKLCELVRRDFVEAFVRRGKFTGISLRAGAFEDFENVFTIAAEGKLKLLINKDLYQSLGLEGRPAAGLPKRKAERFEIVVDLKGIDMTNQSNTYNRIKSAFSNTQIELFDFKLAWQSIDPSVCPSSVAKFFDDLGYEVEQRSIETYSFKVEQFKVPNLEVFERSPKTYVACKIVEYFGSIMLECDTDTDDEINSYKPGFELNLMNESSTSALVLHCRGLLTSEFLKNLLDTLRLAVEGKTVIININAETHPAMGSTNGYLITLCDEKYFLCKT